MILRGLTVSLLFSVLALPAYGQVTPSAPNPETAQTDEDEDAYRQSRRRRDTGDIFKDIDINTRSSGGGGLIGPNTKAIDRLNSGSRRHLNKLRAKAISETPPGEIVKAEYEPSAEAKIDEFTATQEKQAWEEMIREANNGIDIIQGPKGGSNQGQTGQGGGQGPEKETLRQSAETSAPSVWRGGSTSSAAAILDQIKGRSSGGTGQGQSGQAAQSGGQSPEQNQTKNQAQGEGQAQQEAGSQTQNGAQGEAANPSQNSSASQNQSQAEAPDQTEQDQNQSAQASAQGETKSESENQAGGEPASASESSAAAKAARETETFSPLDRLKRDALEQDDTGGRTSASDYLNRGK